MTLLSALAGSHYVYSLCKQAQPFDMTRPEKLQHLLKSGVTAANVVIGHL